jgi:hypothetical protein
MSFTRREALKTLAALPIVGGLFAPAIAGTVGGVDPVVATGLFYRVVHGHHLRHNRWDMVGQAMDELFGPVLDTVLQRRISAQFAELGIGSCYEFRKLAGGDLYLYSDGEVVWDNTKVVPQLKTIEPGQLAEFPLDFLAPYREWKSVSWDSSMPLNPQEARGLVADFSREKGITFHTAVGDSVIIPTLFETWHDARAALVYMDKFAPKRKPYWPAWPYVIVRDASTYGTALLF